MPTEMSGHLVRMDEERMTKRVELLREQVRRRRGGLLLRW